MARFVITPDVGLYLAEREQRIGDEHRLLAPTLFRSEALSLLYRAVRRGELTKVEADRRLRYLRSLRMRLLGDRVLQEFAWKFAEELGLEETLSAEYLALTRLQADALITLDPGLARAAERVVPTAPPEALF